MKYGRSYINIRPFHEFHNVFYFDIDSHWLQTVVHARRRGLIVITSPEFLSAVQSAVSSNTYAFDVNLLIRRVWTGDSWPIETMSISGYGFLNRPHSRPGG